MTASTPPDDPTLPPADRWDARYRARLAEAPPDDEPHPFLVEQAHRLPTSGRALDIATGLGRNALWLARRGLRVTAVDVSRVACDHLDARARDLHLPIDTVCLDLERAPLPPAPFDLIVNTLYLQRSLAPQIQDRLAPGGLLLFLTMLEGGRDLEPPVHKEYLLQRGDLRALFPHLDVVLYREDPADSPVRPNAYLLARKPSHTVQH